MRNQALVVLAGGLLMAACVAQPDPWVPDARGGDGRSDGDGRQSADGTGDVRAVDLARLDIGDLMDTKADAVDLTATEVQDAGDAHETSKDVECVPDCGAAKCGDDGCGGSCGDCGQYLLCAAGSCHPNFCKDGLKDFGCCSGNVWLWCDDDGALEGYNCDDNDAPLNTCGWDSGKYKCGGEGEDPEGDLPLECCESDCTNKDCGSDGCWKDCGTCEGLQEVCVEGICECQPACDGLECGDDGCNDVCGTCPKQSECIDGTCICTPDCDGKSCGSDGCDGECGTCLGDQDECADGQCVCQPNCDGLDCGDGGCPDQPGICEVCTGPQDECVEGFCICQPNCDGKECSDDGCGGDCGICDDENLCNGLESCVAGQCEEGLAVSCSNVPQCIKAECNPLTGECDMPADDGSECSDENACTTSDQCLGGECAPGLATSCKDDTECATYACNPGTGECEETKTPDGTDCDGGIGQCNSGQCVEKCGNEVCSEEDQETCVTCPEDCGTCTVSEGFVPINPSSFWMGSPDGGPCPIGYIGGGCAGDGNGNSIAEVGRQDDEPLTYVSLTRRFEMQTTEVTQGDFKSAFGGWNPGTSSEGDGNAVDSISFFDAVAYANWLSKDAGLSPCYEFTGEVECGNGITLSSHYYLSCLNASQGGIVNAEVVLREGVDSAYDCQGYRLPTEAEWEYATRAGTVTAFSNGNDLDDAHKACAKPYHLTAVGWYCANNDPNGAKPVGQKSANAWGLKDVHGNLFEWVWDSYAAYSLGLPDDPWLDPIGTGNYARVARGGAWSYNASHLRSAVRTFVTPNNSSHTVGFRLARTLAPCGDGICQPQESCQTCEVDCGECPCVIDECPDLAGYNKACNTRNHCEYTRTEPTEDWHQWDVWIYVPPASFEMGSVGEGGSEDETPVHMVTFDAGFMIAKYETVVQQYQACNGEDPDACSTPSTADWTGSGWGTNYWEDGVDPNDGSNIFHERINHPQNGVTWQQAKDFCQWVAPGGRLPSEAEWEYAATGTAHTKYPWGDEPEPSCSNDTAVFNDGRYGCSSGGTWPVGSKLAGLSRCGALDMTGNLWEWCEDWRHDSYADAPASGEPWVSPPGTKRIIRGGGFDHGAANMRTAKRNSTWPTDFGGGNGVRCVRPVPATNCGGVDCPVLAGYFTYCNRQHHCEYANLDTSGHQKWDAWIYVPPDSFEMGGPVAEGGPDDERPIHPVAIEKGYLIGKNEVLVEQYEACREASPNLCTAPSTADSGYAWGTNSSANGRRYHPQNGLNWHQAGDFCAWLAPWGRLPTEAEWKLAASGPTHRIYPWGDSPEPTCENGLAVLNDEGNVEGFGCGQGGTWPAGSLLAGAAWCGALDMGGNLWEWTADWYHDNYNGAPPDGSAWLDPVGTNRVTTGGAFDSDQVRTARREKGQPDYEGATIGARCLRPLACEPACVDKACGDDGCGGTCGSCNDGHSCTVDSCLPDGTCDFEVKDGYCLWGEGGNYPSGCVSAGANDCAWCKPSTPTVVNLSYLNGQFLCANPEYVCCGGLCKYQSCP